MSNLSFQHMLDIYSVLETKQVEIKKDFDMPQVVSCSYALDNENKIGSRANMV